MTEISLLPVLHGEPRMACIVSYQCTGFPKKSHLSYVLLSIALVLVLASTVVWESRGLLVYLTFTLSIGS